MYKENVLILPRFISESLQWKYGSCRERENISCSRKKGKLTPKHLKH